ncbi:Uu.00g116870.m01.CDS01 [Anthostomella pinea]|uniref:Uu.00g116870.m01.CDS01 n=1 Tax=Anthostomella pinea TaxID=933095 RepID=A0AAI8VG59_9PEZI|nr:Uu.00g116870.m01.CDS01 [Anthostomella pinea]
MYSKWSVQLLMVVLSIIVASRATWFNPAPSDLVVRQDVSVTAAIQDDSTTSPADTTADATPTSDDATSTPEETTPATTANPTTADDSPTTETSAADATPTTPTTDATTTTPENTTPTDANTTPTTGATTTLPPTTGGGTTGTTSSASSKETSSGNDDSSSSKSSKTTASPVTFTSIAVITTTNDAGQTVTSSSATAIVSTPALSGSDSSKDNQGISQGTKNTIIGVCVGVGLAIVIAVGGLLFWRLRSKRRSQEENEELVSYGNGFGGPGTAEKSETSAPPNRSPFQSTLESYHAPTQTNAASNF